MRRLIVIVGCVAGIVGCGGSGAPTAPTTPTPPIVQQCEAQKTAILTVENLTRGTLDVFVDGSTGGNIGPGQKTSDIIVAAGVQHNVVTRVTNTNIIACTAQPIPVQCTRTNLVCQ